MDAHQYDKSISGFA